MSNATQVDHGITVPTPVKVPHASNLHPPHEFAITLGSSIYLWNPKRQHGWALQCAQLLKALDEAGSAQYLPPDEELVKEYKEVQKYKKHIESLCAIRLIGCTGYAFGKACEQPLFR